MAGVTVERRAPGYLPLLGPSLSHFVPDRPAQGLETHSLPQRERRPCTTSCSSRWGPEARIQHRTKIEETSPSPGDGRSTVQSTRLREGPTIGSGVWPGSHGDRTCLIRSSGPSCRNADGRSCNSDHHERGALGRVDEHQLSSGQVQN